MTTAMKNEKDIGYRSHKIKTLATDTRRERDPGDES
jgi:hypothetical protein